jgi:AcrR family transcriptional regulator
VERGYYGVGMEEVARAVGVSRQAIYLHFKSKSELVVAMAEYAYELINVPQLIQRREGAATEIEALDLGVRAYGIIEPQIYDAMRIVYSARQSDETAEAVWQDRMAYFSVNARRLIERLEEEGSLTEGWTVDEATDFAWGVLSVHTYENLVVQRGWTIDQFVSRLGAMLRSVLVAEKDDPKE